VRITARCTHTLKGRKVSKQEKKQQTDVPSDHGRTQNANKAKKLSTEQEDLTSLVPLSKKEGGGEKGEKGDCQERT